MKKNFKNTLISLALGAATFCCVAGFLPFMEKNNAQAEAVYDTLSGFEIEEGAAVRTTDYSGLRFTTNITVEKQSEISTLFDNTPQYGTLLLPADMLDKGTMLTHQTPGVVVSVAKLWYDADTYTAVLAGKPDANGKYTNLPSSYYNRPIVARSYVTGTKNGQKVTYYSENQTERSIGYVSVMAQIDGNKDDEGRISTVVDGTDVQVVFNASAQLSVKQSEESTIIVGNKYTKSTDTAATILIGGVTLEEYTDDKYDASITYSSTDTSVISVNGTTLTAEKSGESTITATATIKLKDGTLVAEAAASKTISTDAYKPYSEYKILISGAAESAALREGTGYQPLTEATYSTYYNAFEKTAAYKLQSILEEATGVRLEVVTEKVDGQKYISVGETDFVEEDTLSANVKAKDNASAVKVDGNGNIIICGTTPRGTLFGVQRLLQDLVGYEYYMEYTYDVDSKEVVGLSGDKEYIPAIDHSVIQGGELNRVGALDEYSMQFYTEGIIPMGTLDEEDATGEYYRGIAHSTTFVLDDGTYNAVDTLYLNKYYRYSKADGKAWQKWYATNDKTNTYTQYYHTITNPYYTGTNNTATAVDESVQTIFAELCYTAHGDSDVRNTMIETVATEMHRKMKLFPNLDRIAFAHMDHRVWCECSSCTEQGNPSDNLLEFLLDVAANLKGKLQTAGDDRAKTFKICSLFYHATAATPKNTANYQSELSTYLMHIEPWLCDSGMDHIDPYELTETEKSEISNNNNGNNWNASMYSAIEFWGNLCKDPDHQTDMFFWDYYQNTTSFFIPYNVFNTLRKNYGTFAKFEYDFVFSQMMESKQNFARFKEFLISKLKWNANPNDDEWDAWYTEYFEGAYGPGATEMRNYFNQWNTWTTSHSNDYRRDGAYDWKSETGTAALGVDMRTWTDKLTAEELQTWIDSIDEALKDLDTDDPKYETYRRNIMLEKLTPMYLLMWMHDGYTPVKDEENLPWPYIDPNTPGTFSSTEHVSTYGAEFLAWVAEWGITRDGEAAARVLAPFLAAIDAVDEVDKGTISNNQYVTERQYIDVSETATFSNSLFVDGTYTVSGGVSDSATVKNGVATLNTNALTPSQSYTISFTNSNGTITFTDVVAVKKIAASAGAQVGNNDYYYIDKTYYVEDGKTQLTLTHGIFEKGKTYEVNANGELATVSTFTAGQLNVVVGELANGQNCEVICVDENNNTYVFNVVSAYFIRTAEELKALGVGGNRGSTENIYGYYALANDITFEHADDYSDLVAAGYPSGDTGKYAFKGTFDGCGYTLYNMRVSDGGIFGIMHGTVKNLNMTNVHILGLFGDTTYTNQRGAYTAILAFGARGGVFENINITIASSPSEWTWQRDGLFVNTGSQGAATFRNITVDASGLKLKTLLGISHNDSNVYENVVIKAADYVAIGYTGDSYNEGVENTAVKMTEKPDGVTITTVTNSFEIANKETVLALGSVLTITTDVSGNYTYELINNSAGVTIEGATVTVPADAKLGATFTVKVTEANGCVREMTFQVGKTEDTFDFVPVMEAVKNDTSFEIPNEIEGTIRRVTANGRLLFDRDKAIGSIENGRVIPDSMSYEQAYLGNDLALIIETDTTYYTGKIDICTMVIDDKAELNQWQEISAQAAIDQGICLDVQKGFVYSGYFILGADIEYNGIWMPYKAATNGGNQLWSLVYNWDAAAGAGVVKPELYDENDELIDGAIVEDWGAGKNAGFKGVFDGDGHYISGMQTTGEYNAFIVTMGGGTIKNVAFTNAKIGSTASLIANRGNGFFENVYVQVTAMESGTSGKSTQVLMKSANMNNDWLGMENVIVDVSAIDYASLTWAFVANLAYGKSNIYVVGMPEGIELQVTAEQETPIVFMHCNPNEASTTEYDDADAFVDYKALLDGTEIEAWNDPWNVTAKDEILFGEYMIFDNLVVEDLDNVVAIISINDGTFETPAEIEGTVTGVEFGGVDVFTSVNGNVVSFNKGLMPTLAAELGEGKALTIKTTAGTYNLKANVYTDIITTTQELRDLGVGGMVYTDRTPIYNNSKGAIASAGGNGNSGVEGNDVTGYYILGNDLYFEGEDAVAAGYTFQKSWFKGTFDGKGYTIYDIAVNEGGIFGGMRNATVKNVNFENVVYDMSFHDYAGQYSQQTALLAHVADSSTFEKINVQVSSVKRNASGWPWATFVYNFWNSCTVKDVTIDASYLALSSVLGTDSQSQVSYTNVKVKAASYATIGKQGSTDLTEWPTGVSYETITEGVIPGRPTTNTGDDIATYKGDATGFGFAEDANVFEITSGNQWSDRIIFPVSTAYDYVEFDIYLTANLTYLTGWPAKDGTTQGDMSIYARNGMFTSNGLVRTVQVFDANGNGFKDSGFVANKLYTVRVGFNDNEAVELNQFHIGLHANQTYYVSAARFGSYSDTEMRIYNAETDRNVLPYYDGDVTAVGYAADTKVTAATMTDGWSNRVRVNGDLNFDYVDLQFSVNRTGVTYFTIWMYGVDGGMLSGAYHAYTTSISTDAAIQNKKIQYFDASGRGTSVASFAANTVYTVRVYLDGATAFDFGTFSASEANPVTLYLGKITYGNVTDLAETVQIEVEEGSFALPTTIDGTVTSVILEGKEILSSVEGGKAIINGGAVTAFGQEKALFIETTEGTYSLYADVATRFITTADELKALGVGGNRTNTENISGYFALANDITFEHANDYSDLVAAGYPANGDYSFKGTFDGFGHTLYNMRVSDGGIFGIMRGTVKNLNLINVYLIDSPPAGVSNQSGGYISIIAFVAPGGTIENINITMASSPNAWSWKRDGLLVNSGSWGSTTFRNITVDASGLKLKTLLGISHNANNVYENVEIIAADYVAIGYTGDSYNNGVQNTEAMMSEFPAGVTFKYSYYMNFVPLAIDSSMLPVYTGNVKALGFAEGTTVYEAVQDNRTNMWAAGTNLGLSMEAQRVRITKGLAEDYASVQFSLSRATTTNQLFFAWYMAEPKAGGSRPSTSVYLMKDGSSGNSNGISAIAFDMNGKKATSFVPGQAYELRWYDANHIAYGFEFGCCEQNGEAITVYYANPSSGNSNPVTVGNTSTSNLGVYMGDETAVGFAEGTDVYYEVQDNRTNAWAAGTKLALTMEQQTVVITKKADEEYASIQFSLSRELTAAGSIFTAWWYDEAAANKGLCGYLKADGTYTSSIAATVADFKVEVYDMDGNKVTKLEANTAYEMRWYGTGITQFKIGCLEANGESFTIYYANPSSSNNA